MSRGGKYTKSFIQDLTKGGFVSLGKKGPKPKKTKKANGGGDPGAGGPS